MASVPRAEAGPNQAQVYDDQLQSIATESKVQVDLLRTAIDVLMKL